MTLPLHGIRSLARRYGYEEIIVNEYSRLISFRGGPCQSTRINVYYTTGTVGTCLRHPKKGKTQLFRCGIQTLDQLESIFDNPRLHTGAGYYERKNIRDQWKDPKTHKCLCDSARRWYYVGGATGLVKNERELNTITDICTAWDNLCWNPGTAPDLTHCRYECGSHGGLFEMLFEVVLNTCGDFQVCANDDVMAFHAGKMTKPEGKMVVCGKGCERLQAFLEAHSTEVHSLKHQFMSLRKDARIELFHWFLSRAEKDHCFTDLDIVPFRSKYYDAVHFAHNDYGDMVYPKEINMCSHCGVLSMDE